MSLWSVSIPTVDSYLIPCLNYIFVWSISHFTILVSNVNMYVNVLQFKLVILIKCSLNHLSLPPFPNKKKNKDDTDFEIILSFRDGLRNNYKQIKWSNP